MLTEQQFVEQLADAYEHLYDLVYLRTHPLTDLLVVDADLQRKEKAWQLHRLLLQVIEELDPGPQVPAFSHEWRRHRLMVLHYQDGLDPQSVADELAISRRHYYREHEAAIEAIGTVLWQRHIEQEPETTGAAEAPAKQPASGLELLRLEAARMAQADRYARIGEVAGGVLSLLQEVLHQRRLKVRLDVPQGLPGIPIDRGLLRQMLLAMLGHLIERTERATIELLAGVEAGAFHVSVMVEPATAVRVADPAEDQARLSALEEMASLGEARLAPARCGQTVVGFRLELDTAARRTILVVDDNEDVLALFHRYLSLHNYRVVPSQTAQEALDQARRLQPHAITVDLMMPGQDGWDLLQTLLNQADTRHIPIIVCSVLKQKELALSLGATAFLEKPVTEQALLGVLGALGDEGA